MDPATAPWWQRAVFYQIYPRSFLDSDGDGLGDLPGITARLSHLAGEPYSLGVDALWISPFYPSPMRDFGYDVSDYCDVDPRFGTLADFDALLAEAHRRGLRVIIDLVLNHTSDEHPWFVEARSSRSHPRHDWYLWSDRPRPNNWRSAFELRNAWWPNEATGEWYLGTFTRHQPEVNWRNPELKEAMRGVMRFWLNRGVDGFRLDVVNWFLKDEARRSNPVAITPPRGLFQRHLYDRNQPETIDLCRELRAVTDEYEERMMIGEVYADDLSLAASYHGERADALHLAFNFNFLFQPWSAARFASAAQAWYAALPPGAWPNFTLSNHDQPRHYSRYARGGESDARARVAAAMLLSVRGTPFLYYGEELGMSDTRIPRSRLQDPLGRSTWPLRFGRDPQRTPMQWNAGRHAGFSDAEPWLPVNQRFREVNVVAQREEPDSLLAFYRRLLALRRAEPALSLGELEWLARGERDVLSWVRRPAVGSPAATGDAVGAAGDVSAAGDATASVATRPVFVALNFSRRERRIDLAASPGMLLVGTHRSPGDRSPLSHDGRCTLAPYEVAIWA